MVIYWYNIETSNNEKNSFNANLEYDVLGGLNLWTYCNTPIMYVNPDGNDWDSFWSGFWKVVGSISIIGVITVASALTLGVIIKALNILYYLYKCQYFVYFA